MRGFILYRNGARVGATRTNSATFYGLGCGTSYRLAVQSVDGGGNRSQLASTQLGTALCRFSREEARRRPAGVGASRRLLNRALAPLRPFPRQLLGPRVMVGVVFLRRGAPLPAPVPPSSGGPRVFVSPGGSDAGVCSQAQPCRSFGRGYVLVGSGGVVEVADGSYPAQEIVFDPGKGPGVVFEPAAGASVSVAVVDFGQAEFGRPGPRGVSVRNMRIGMIRSWAGSDGLRWENIDAKSFAILNSSNVTILGGDFGPCQAPAEGRCLSFVAGARNVTIEGAYIHDVTSTDLANYHVDGLFVRGATNLTIRGSKFRGNDITNIRFQNQECCANANVTLENNWFAASLQGNGLPRADAIDIDNPIPNLLIRNNSFAENAGPAFDPGAGTGARVVGKSDHNLGCAPGVAYVGNLFIPFNEWTGQTPCGPNDKKVSSFGYVNAGGFDYHITAASPANGAGAPGNCPSVDIDGDGRSSSCDAGSDER